LVVFLEFCLTTLITSVGLRTAMRGWW